MFLIWIIDVKKLTKILLISLFLFSGLASAKGISVDSPYVREVPPGQMTSASFLILKNDSAKNIALIKASSDVAKNVELHEHVHEGGMMKMRQVKQIDVAANSATSLKPGGYHIMLIGLTRKIKAGDRVNINLEFDNGDKKTIKAEVKKIMQGMMMNKMAKMDKIKSHVNPMPNLMKVYKKMAGKLNLNKDQIVKLDAGIKERGPKIKALTKTVIKLEEELKNAILDDKSLNVVDRLADKLMQNRLAIIQGKVFCRESAREVLNKEQFNKMVAIYREKMMPKPMKMNEMQTKMAMIKHTNPLPNLMQVVKKMSDKLNLTEKQAAELKQWGKERGPIMAKNYKAVLKLEKELLEVALNNEPVAKINEIADGIMQMRMRIVRGKAFCRDNMKRILDDNQFRTVIDLYKANFS